MKTERIVLRPRSQAQAMDLGFALARANVGKLLGVAALFCILISPVLLLVGRWSPWLALLLAWWLKPLLDRALLQVLAMDLLQLANGPRVILRQPGRWLANGWKAGLSLWRFHPARAFLLPVWQLEKQQGEARRRRQRSLTHGNQGSGIGLTVAFWGIELCLWLSILLVAGWLLPLDFAWLAPGGWLDSSTVNGQLLALWLIGAYLLTITLTEPFYVAAGLGLYLNQRCRLECWDLEPGLRALGARHAGQTTRSRRPDGTQP